MNFDFLFLNVDLLLSFNYILAVFALSLQQDFEVPEQQDFPLAHFLCLPLPLSANARPEKRKAAVANKNTFFILLIFVVINRGKSNGERAECQVCTVNY